MNFFDTKHLEVVKVLSYSERDFSPTNICKMSAEELLLVGCHDNWNCSYVQKMNCCCSCPAVAGSNDMVITSSIPSNVRDTCFTRYKDLQLLFAAEMHSIHALDLKTGKNRWNEKTKIICPFSLTADDQRGHLFVYDRHYGCVEMFSVSDSKYLGRVLTEGEPYFGYYFGIKWCSLTSSLILKHARDNNLFITELKIAIDKQLIFNG